MHVLPPVFIPQAPRAALRHALHGRQVVEVWYLDTHDSFFYEATVFLTRRRGSDVDVNDEVDVLFNDELKRAGSGFRADGARGEGL